MGHVGCLGIHLLGGLEVSLAEFVSLYRWGKGIKMFANEIVLP
jgi:hypothetical protein